jgi:hypothetical protein
VVETYPKGDILKDELLLAQLLLSKLSSLLQGMMSVGTTALRLKTAKEFFAGRDRPKFALIDALAFIRVRSGSKAESELRARTTQLSNLTRSFYNDLTTLSEWHQMETDLVNRVVAHLKHTFLDLLIVLRGFSEFLGVAFDYDRQHAIAIEMIDGLSTYLRNPGQES